LATGAIDRIGAGDVELHHVMLGYEVFAGCDVVHDHTVLGPAWALAAGHHRVVTTCHGPFDSELRTIYSRYGERLPVVAISHAQAARTPEIAIDRVIHHGLDPDQFPVGRGDGGYLLFLGRMTEDKGVRKAVLVARAAGHRLLIAAKMREPAERAYFAEQVQPLLGDDVVLVGEVTNGDKLALLGGAAALLNPIRWSEPFGLVMIEALACGTPVLTCPLGAAPEIVDSGVTGFLCLTTTGSSRPPGASTSSTGLPAAPRWSSGSPPHGWSLTLRRRSRRGQPHGDDARYRNRRTRPRPDRLRRGAEGRAQRSGRVIVHPYHDLHSPAPQRSRPRPCSHRC
jgi:hypothetical protein